MTGHYRFEKQGGKEQEDHRKEIIKQLEELGIPPKGLAGLPDGALQELLHALKKAKNMHKNSND